jgi:predicted Abi (CAAX) family protease
MQCVFACAQSAHNRLLLVPHCPVESAREDWTIGVALAAPQYCLGRRSNCSEDDMVIAHVRTAKRFPGFERSVGDGQRSFERAGANSSTRRQISIGQELRGVAYKQLSVSG